MVLVWIFVAVLAMVCVAAAWPDVQVAIKGIRQAREHRASAGAAPSVGEPHTLEGVLVQQMMTGRIGPAQYRRAMADIALRDASRHPVKLPPDYEPPQTR